MGCDWYFEPEDYRASELKRVVHQVRADTQLSKPEKKFLILCWFDTVFGKRDGIRLNVTESRTRLSQFLKDENHTTLETWFAAI